GNQRRELPHLALGQDDAGRQHLYGTRRHNLDRIDDGRIHYLTERQVDLAIGGRHWHRDIQRFVLPTRGPRNVDVGQGRAGDAIDRDTERSEEHTSELQSLTNLV